MDSKIVNRRIKEDIWPLLRTQGFLTFSSRTAWRHLPTRIDVLNFQSFNSYNAGVIGCTTFSFALNLGSYWMAIPPQFEPSRIKQKDGCLFPQEFECHLRGRLIPTIPQPELRATNIWVIDKAGVNLDVSMQDAALSIANNGLGWFDQFSSPREVLRILLNEPEDMTRLHGFGRNPSPIRHYLAGYIALSLNDTGTANQQLKNALLSGCFSSVKDRLTHDIRRTNAPTSAAI